MGVKFFLLIGPLNNKAIYFADANFTGLALKMYIITFTTKDGVSWWPPPMNPINNSSRLNSKMIAINYCYQLLLQIVTEASNRIIQRFGEGTENHTGTKPLVIYFLNPKNILKLMFFLPPSIYTSPGFRNTYCIYTLTWTYSPYIRICCTWLSCQSWPPWISQPPSAPSTPQHLIWLRPPALSRA